MREMTDQQMVDAELYAAKVKRAKEMEAEIKPSELQQSGHRVLGLEADEKELLRRLVVAVEAIAEQVAPVQWMRKQTK